MDASTLKIPTLESGTNFDFIKLTLIALTSCTLVPLIILLRQYLGWAYISRRLLSDYISYEEINKDKIATK